VDFLARKTPEEVYARCRNLIALSATEGGYALGSGNSVPDYIPNENFIAMLRAANEGY
jgi:uroporphyrinogen decarboxylase